VKCSNIYDINQFQSLNEPVRVIVDENCVTDMFMLIKRTWCWCYESDWCCTVQWREM